MNAWDTHHARTSALRDVTTRLDAGEDLPWDDSLAAIFGDRAGLLVALYDFWNRRLLARLDLALELHDIPSASVAEAWSAVNTELRGVRRILDEYDGHPALVRCRQHELRSVAVAAHLASLADPPAVAAARGARFLAVSRNTLGAARRDGWLAERLSRPFAFLSA